MFKEFDFLFNRNSPQILIALWKSSKSLDAASMYNRIFINPIVDELFGQW
jgi:hypothetical protein